MTMQPHDMSDDETILRVKAALRSLPPADPNAVARVLSAVHGRTPQPTPRWRMLMDWMRMPSLSVAGTAGMVVVALAVGYLANGRLQLSRSANSGRTDAAGNGVAANGVATNAIGNNGVQDGGGQRVAVEFSRTAGAASVIPANASADAEREVAVQFVLDLPGAHTVSVVGDFNDWTVDQAPMQRFANGAWNITLPVKPGRHEYAFVVDGVRWMADPRAPKARHSDFDKPGSVIVVTKP